MLNTINEIPADQTVRLATFNILHNPERAEERANQLADEIIRLGIAIIVLQEVIFEGHPTSAFLARVASRTGMHINSTFLDIQEEDGRQSGLAVMSRYEAQEVSSVFLIPRQKSRDVSHDALLTTLNVSGRTVHIFNTHLAWGGQNENLRLRSVVAINKHADALAAQDPTAIIYLAGDMNAAPEGPAMQYLKGRYIVETEDTGAYWVDVWEHLRPEDRGITSSGRGYWARSTAINNGIAYPDLLPERRIDHIFAYGWAYGRAGTPLRTELFVDTPGAMISDHAGIWTDIWVPPLTKD